MEYKLADWLMDDFRIVQELESLLKYLNVPIGDLQTLRDTVDTINKQRK